MRFNISSNRKVSNDNVFFLEMLRIHWRDSAVKKNQMISMVQSLYLAVALWSELCFVWFISIWVVTVHWPSELQIFQATICVCLYLFVSQNNYWFFFLFCYLLCLILRYDHWNERILLSQFGHISKIHHFQWIECLCPLHCLSHRRILTSFIFLPLHRTIADCFFLHLR